MDGFEIIGQTPLKGEFSPHGAKNAALLIMAASLLSEQELEVSNLPKLNDTQTLIKLLTTLGVVVTQGQQSTTFQTKKTENYLADYQLVKKMRASILVLAPLLAKRQRATVALPGGCAIGQRPVDLHLWALEKLGAKIFIKNGYIYAKCHKLKGCVIDMPIVSVTATAQIIMASVLACGTTVLKNIAIEPEVINLIDCLIAMGASIDKNNIEKRELVIDGVQSLTKAKHRVIPDRIEAITYLLGGIITGGQITLNHINLKHIQKPLDILNQAGIEFSYQNGALTNIPKERWNAINITTLPYPEFPTDLQAQFVVFNILGDGQSTIFESIFENRFMHIAELNRMGANIQTKGRQVYLTGNQKLFGTDVMATDLRASASLVLAALCAKGVSRISRIYHIDRGYQSIEIYLNKLGAKIKRINI